MWRALCVSVFLVAIPGLALAACPAANSVQIQSSGTSQNYASTDDGSGNCQNQIDMRKVGGTNITLNPCDANAQTITPISVASTGPTTIVAGTSGKQTYVCGVFVAPVAAAINFTLVSGSGTNCGTAVHSALFGGTTAANGANLAINSGFVISGPTAFWVTTTLGDNICLTASSSGQISGSIVTVAQ